MLATVDRVLEWAGWLGATALVVMLFAGPAIVANDNGHPGVVKAGASPYAQPAGAPDGAKIFTANCGSCHTLSKAGTSGPVGPSLDGTGLSASAVAAKVQSGGGIMPAFAGKLGSADIAAVAQYVAGG